MIHNIFLDIQLNNATGEILTISALGCDNSFIPLKQFFAIVKTDNLDSISNEELSYHLLTRERLTAAKHPQDIIESFLKNLLAKTPEEGHLYIFWNAQTMQLFEQLAESCGYVLPLHRTVNFQEVMSFIDVTSQGLNDLEYYMQKFGYDYKSAKMHDSDYFIDIMSDFYKHIRFKLFDNQKLRDIHLPIVKGSFEFHKPSCYYTENITEFELGRVSPSSVMNGYVPCESCKNDSEWRKDIFSTLDLTATSKQISYKIVNGIEIGSARRKLTIVGDQFDPDVIAKICSYFDFTFTIEPYAIVINTGKSSWIIRHNNFTVDVLLHENRELRTVTQKRTRNNGRLLDAYRIGYHDQKVDLSDLIDICEYIYKHDLKKNYSSKS